MTADKVYVAGKRAVILRLTVKPCARFISLLFPQARVASVSVPAENAHVVRAPTINS